MPPNRGSSHLGRFSPLLLLASMAIASCVYPPIEEIPVGTYTISRDGIPDELETDAMTVTLTDETVTFAYTTREGEDVVVTYEIED